MVNRRMKPEQAVQFVRKAARKAGLSVEPAPERDRGSHQNYRLVDSDGNEVGAFGVTRHPRELSWKVLHSIEDGLADLFGNEHWMEK